MRFSTIRFRSVVLNSMISMALFRRSDSGNVFSGQHTSSCAYVVAIRNRNLAIKLERADIINKVKKQNSRKNQLFCEKVSDLFGG
jgi:hypothetical protein